MPDFIYTDNPLAIHYAIPGFFILLLIEIGVATWEQRDWYETKDTISSLSIATTAASSLSGTAFSAPLRPRWKNPGTGW